MVYVPSKSKAQSSRSVASAKKGRIVREAKVGSKPRLRGNKRVMTAEVKRSSKLRTGAKARNARVRVASAR